MTMILRVLHDDTEFYGIFHVQQSTRIVHYDDITIWYYSFDGLYNKQLRSVVRGHGVGYDNDGWVWNEWVNL